MKEKEGRRGEMMIKSQRADLEHEDNDDHELGEQMNDVFGSDIENLSYDPEPQV